MEVGSLVTSVAAFGVSIVSLVFAVISWRESNRPIIVIRTTSFGQGGDVSTPLSLLVENTGNRPAIKIRLDVSHEQLASVLIAEKDDPLRAEIEAIFSNEGMIPVLGNGKWTSNGFGLLSHGEGNTWAMRRTIQVAVSYEDLDGRNFSHTIPLLVADDEGFAGGYWRQTGKIVR